MPSENPSETQLEIQEATRLELQLDTPWAMPSENPSEKKHQWAMPSENPSETQLEIQEATRLEPQLENQWVMPSENPSETQLEIQVATMVCHLATLPGLALRLDRSHQGTPDPARW
jgi:hypothetical protein